MTWLDYVIDFILKYLVCPWDEISSYTVAVMLSSVGLLILVFILISLNNINDFIVECRRFRIFIYVTCIFIIPCFGILLPIYLFIPAVILSILEIKKKEKVEIQKLYNEHSINDDFSDVYSSVRANTFLELLIIIISSVIIILIMHFVGFNYHFVPTIPKF